MELDQGLTITQKYKLYETTAVNSGIIKFLTSWPIQHWRRGIDNGDMDMASIDKERAISNPLIQLHTFVRLLFSLSFVNL